jgi:hypothetical protein
MKHFDEATDIFRPLIDRLNELAHSEPSSVDRDYLAAIIANLINVYIYSNNKFTEDRRRTSLSDDEIYELIGIYATCMRPVYKGDIRHDYISNRPLVIIHEIIDYVLNEFAGNKKQTTHHTIEYNHSSKSIEISRYIGKQPVLYTRYALGDVMKSGFDAFARQIGEDLILDNEILRDALNI